LPRQAALLTGKDNKKERAAKGKEVAELKAEQRFLGHKMLNGDAQSV